jgi:sugar phosphate isomerase/epimerase
MSNTSRRQFLTQLAGAAVLGIGATSCTMNRIISSTGNNSMAGFFEISLAEWSFHKALHAGKMTNLDFPVIAKQQYGINVVEYVNQFFKDKAKDTNYLNEILKRCKDNGVRNHLIMCDGEGNLGDTDSAKRTQAVENHYKWVEAAKYLGCRTIRVNAAGNGSAEEVQKAAIDGLSRLAEYAAKENINVIVENHGGYSSNALWLTTVMKSVNQRNLGVLPDFNNFCLKREGANCTEEYDRYKGVTEMMPFAKGASAKTIDFDENGNCIETDYYKMLKIIKDSGFHGYIGIEYEGEKLSEEEGVRKTKALLEKVAASFV